LEIKALREAMPTPTLTMPTLTPTPMPTPIPILTPTLSPTPTPTPSVEKPKPIAKYISAMMIQEVFQIDKKTYQNILVRINKL